jgi:hypothetical protein
MTAVQAGSRGIDIQATDTKTVHTFCRYLDLELWAAAAPDMEDGLHWTRWRRRYHGMTSDRRTQVLNLGALSTNRRITSSAAPPILTP